MLSAIDTMNSNGMSSNSSLPRVCSNPSPALSKHNLEERAHLLQNSRQTQSNKACHITTLCVVGLSGADQVKGTSGVGKSTLCNRLVRPHFVDFHLEHLSYLSQADFSCSRVINNDHWLYWGETELDSTDYSTGKTTHVRLVEQTVFLDDESFEPLGNHCSKLDEAGGSSYGKRALKTTLESADKLMYICRDQLGQESDFVCHSLKDGRTGVDAFCVVFDVSRVEGRSPEKQASFVIQLVVQALKTRKPVFLVATKCDIADTDMLREFHKLLQRKELRTTTLVVAEVSAAQNVNIADFLYLVAFTVDKVKNRPRMIPYLDALNYRNEKLVTITYDFHQLVCSLLPREEFPLKRGKISWSILLTDFGVNCHPAYEAFTAEFGPKAARLAFEEHQRACREWWFEHDLNARLPSLRDVLRRMLDRSLLCNAKWEQIQVELEGHPEFDNYFQPLGRSLDRLSSSGIGSSSSSSSHSQYWDDRIPGEVLAKPEAQHLFHELQKELIDEISLERQADKFRNLLAQKEAVTPGKSFKDAKVMVEEISAYEKVLPPDSAYRIYATFQEELKQQAKRNFTELLLENLQVFVDIVVDWRLQFLDLPMIGLNEKENNLVHDLLCQDKRYREMNGLSEDKQTAIGQFASFVSLPLERHCPAGNLCADLVLPIAIENQGRDQNKFLSIDVAVHGQVDLVDEFIGSIKKLIAPEKVFRYNGCSVRLNAFPAASCKVAPQLSTDNLLGQSSRVSSTIYLLDSFLPEDNYYEHMPKRHHHWLPPLFVQVCEPNMLPPQMGLKLAEKFHGVFVRASSPSSAMRTGGNRRSDSSSTGSSIMVGHLRERFNSATGTDLSAHFRCEQLTRVLREVCSSQLDSGYCDLRVRLSLFCGDSFPPESILMPFLDHSTRCDPSGRTFSLDIQLGQEGKEHNIRVSVKASSYHNWLLSRWPLNSFQGHILVYSCVRKASWRHAKTAARLLINSLDEGSEERVVMARSIMLLAVNEPTAFFTSNEANQLLTKGSKLAEELGCCFNTVLPTRNSSAQVHTYIHFFQQLYNNPLLPSDYFTISPRYPRSPSFLSCSQQHRVQRQPSYPYTKGSTLTGSANTLLSNYDSRLGIGEEDEAHYAVVELQPSRPSTTSYCSGCCHLSAAGSTAGSSRASEQDMHNTPVLNTCSLCEHSSSGKASVKEHLKDSGVARSVDGLDSSTSRSTGRPQSAVFSHASLSFGGRLEKEAVMTGSEHTPPSSTKAQRRLDKIISSFIQLKSTEEEQRPAVRCGVLQRHNSTDKITPPASAAGSLQSTAKRPTPPPPPPKPSFLCKSNCQPDAFSELDNYVSQGVGLSQGNRFPTVYNSPAPLRHSVEDQCGGLLSRSMDSLVVPTVISIEQQQHTYVLGEEEPPNHLVYKPFRRQISLRDRQRSNKRSFFSNEGRSSSPNSNFARRMASSWRRKKPTRDNDAPEEAGSITSSPFSWLPHRSPKRQFRAKSEGAHWESTSKSSSASSPSEEMTLQSMCRNASRLPLFLTKCLDFIEANGGMQMEGIYRVPGNQSQVAELEKAFKKSDKVDLETLNIPVHATATALKKFLDVLSEPLIPTSSHKPILASLELPVQQSPTYIDDFSPTTSTVDQHTERIKRLQQVVGEVLPPLNRHVLRHLAQHLKRVASNSTTNSMDFRNLAKVWGPTLFRPNFDSFEMMASSLARFELAAYVMLSNCDSIFLPCLV